MVTNAITKSKHAFSSSEKHGCRETTLLALYASFDKDIIAQEMGRNVMQQFQIYYYRILTQQISQTQQFSILQGCENPSSNNRMEAAGNQRTVFWQEGQK